MHYFFMLFLGVIVCYSIEITGINALILYAIFGCNSFLILLKLLEPMSLDGYCYNNLREEKWNKSQ
jgi:hypothetical protein